METVGGTTTNPLDSSRRLRTVSLYTKAYGDKVKLLAEEAKSSQVADLFESKTADESVSVFKKSKQAKPRQRLNASLEFGCWVLKIKNASLIRNRIVFQRRYLFLKDDILYYSHSEFNPEISTRHCRAIQLSASMEYNYPSEVKIFDAHSRKSIDLRVGDRLITFVSDDTQPNSGSFIVTLYSTLKQMSELKTPPEDMNELNKMYLEALDSLGIPEIRWDAMVATETKDRKWTLIVQNKQNVISGNVLVQSCIELLHQPDLQISEMREIRSIITTSPKAFLEKFNNLNGFGSIQQIMLGIALNPNRTRNDLLMLHEFLSIVRSILKTHDLLMWFLDVEDFVYTILLCAFLRQPDITNKIFMFLTIISRSSRGHEQVLYAVDELMLFAQEKVRFQSILSLLSTTRDIDTVTNILVFINVLIQQSDSIAVKMAIYTDLFTLGFDGMHDSLMNRFPNGADEITNIFGIFMQEMQEDREAAIFSGVDCSDVVDMIQVIQKQTQDGSNWEYLCNLLRILLVIPHDSLVGRDMWKLIVRTANSVVTTNYYQDREYVTDEELKELVTQRDLLNEKYDMIQIREDMEEQYKEQIKELERQLQQPMISQSSSEYLNKLVNGMVTQLKDFVDLRYMRNDQVYSKYFAMMENGMPMADILTLCRQEGNDEEVVRGPPVVVTFKDDILQRLQARGIVPAVVPASNQVVTSAPAAQAPAAAASGPESDPNNPRNNPAYKKWFKLLDMHIPKEHLIIKMEAEGVDPSILDYQAPAAAQNPKEDASQDIWNTKAASQSAAKPKPKPKPVIQERRVEPRRRQLRIVPESRMKNLYWDCIDNAAIEGSLWEKMHDTTEKEIDYGELETLFAAKENTFLMNMSQRSTEQKAEKEEKKVQLIRDDKRLRNVGMAIARLKRSTEELRDAILEVDDKILDTEMIRILVSNCPTDEEIEIMKGYEGDVNVLEGVDRFFKVLSTIPDLKIRLQCIQIRNSFSNSVEDLRNQIDRFKVALEKCVHSEKLGHLLEIILAIGNFLNEKSNRRGYYGFQLSYLPKLRDTKSVDNKQTLLDFLYAQLEQGANSSLLSVLDDFKFLSALKGQDYLQISQEFADYEKKFNTLGMQDKKKKCASNDIYPDKMKLFHTEHLKEVQSVRRLTESVDSLYKEFVKKYACPRDYTISNIIDDLATFFEQLREVRERVEKNRELLEQQRKSEAASKAFKEQLQRSKREHKPESEDLFGDFDNLKKTQMSSRPSMSSRGGKLSPLGTLHGRQPIRLDSSDVMSSHLGWNPRSPGFDFAKTAREIPHLGLDSTIKMAGSKRMETMKNGQTLKGRHSGVFFSDGSEAGFRDNSSSEHLAGTVGERLPKGFGIIDPLGSFTSTASSPRLQPSRL